MQKAFTLLLLLLLSNLAFADSNGDTPLLRQKIHLS